MGAGGHWVIREGRLQQAPPSQDISKWLRCLKLQRRLQRVRPFRNTGFGEIFSLIWTKIWHTFCKPFKKVFLAFCRCRERGRDGKN
jgi:hypothetical protein